METCTMTRTNSRRPRFDVVLFDLGGVLIELAGLPVMMAWTRHRMDTDAFWHKWLSSGAVRSFESGRSTPEDFAASMVREFSLEIDEEAFLAAFIHWPKRTFPGAKSLLTRLSSTFKLGILSNTNALHWQRLENDMQLGAFFDFHFPSHLTGRLKPDREAFEYVLEKIGRPPGRVLFFDDNDLNVSSARRCGIEAYRTAGIQPVLTKLEELNIFSEG